MGPHLTSSVKLMATYTVLSTWRERGSTRAWWPARIVLALAFFVALLGTVSTAQAASVTAMWNPNPESDIAGYKLLYGTQSGVYSTTIDVGNVTTWTLTTLSLGTRYFFVVRAYNTALLLSPPSAEVFFDIPGPPTITSQPQSRTVPLGLPATLSVGASSGTPPSYQWYEGASGTTTAPIAGATADSFTTPALTASTSYWVRVTNTIGSTNSATAAITVGAATPGLLVQDTFTGSVGTLLTAHLADVNLTSNPWAVTGGPPTPTLTTSAVGVTAGSGHMQSTINSGVADIVMGVDYRVGSGAGMGALAVRLTDVNNYFVFETYLNTLNLYKRQGGTWIFLASQPLPALAPGSTHRLEVRTLGATLEGWWDGVRLLQVSDSFQQTATRHGLDWNTAYDTTSIYDNFQLAVQQ
jgi:hypothetical protein